MAWRWTEFRLRIALLAASFALLLWFFYLARGVLLPLLLGLVFILVMSPVVGKLERLLPPHGRVPKLRRYFAIVIVYLAFLLLIAGVLISAAPMLITQGARFIQDYPELLVQARDSLTKMFGNVLGLFSPDLRLRAAEITENALNTLIGAVSAAASDFGRRLTSSLGLVVTFLSIPIWSFYVLMDRDTLGAGFIRLFPESVRDDVENLCHIAVRVLGSYFRSQLLLGVIVGSANFIGFTLLGVPYAPLLGLVAGLGEMLPVLGPWLGAIPALLVALAMAPSKLLGVGLIALGVQMVENYLLVPKIQGWTLRLHPAVIIVLLILGTEVAGLWGAILIVPLAAVFRDIFIYLYQRWSQPAAVGNDTEHILVHYPVPESKDRVEKVTEEVEKVIINKVSEKRVEGPPANVTPLPQREQRGRQGLKAVPMEQPRPGGKRMGGLILGIIMGALLMIGLIIWMIGSIIA